MHQTQNLRANIGAAAQRIRTRCKVTEIKLQRFLSAGREEAHYTTGPIEQVEAAAVCP
ncbi:MAG: hypothetical protein IPI72_05890 [Flavobacteriales bacterium]|nr:hypothetical protein [Flavobacteriales bacterium]MBK8708680.1 hypothetical protein [Flavobacteriales bacterium]